MSNPNSDRCQPRDAEPRPRRKLRALQELIEKYFPWLGRQLKRKYWEKAWSKEGEQPESLSNALPTEIKQAAEEGWLAEGWAIMDIGCGRGQISAWLAERGYRVTGGDLADAAVDLARQYFPDYDNRLSFRQLDICQDKPEPGHFDAAVDRGCFHGIPDHLKTAYVENVSSWVRPQGRLLLLTRVDDSPEQTLAQIQALFGERFEIERSAPAVEPLARSAGPLPRRQAPGMAFWMLRT